MNDSLPGLCRNLGLVITALALCACRTIGDAPTESARPCTLAIANVAVVPMSTPDVLPNQTIRIDGDRVVSIAPAAGGAAGCEQIIDGSGLYALPGLNDMHVHLESDSVIEALQIPPTPFRFEDVLTPYLAYGVTGVRVMSGAPDILAFRDASVASAPDMIVASPMLSGSPPILPEPLTKVVSSPEEAASMVRQYAEAGYDLIKVRRNLPTPVLEAVVSAAADVGLDVDGHLPAAGVPLPGYRRGVAHLNELAIVVLGRNSPDDVADRLTACECYVTSTMAVDETAAAQMRDFDTTLDRPETRYVHPMLREGLWARERNPYLAEGQGADIYELILDIDMQLVREIRERGIPLIAGTDALIPMIVPGASMHDELRLLVQAGLTPYEAISAATRTPAVLFERFADLGTLETGKIANILLVEGNPLEDVGSLRRPQFVILRGRPFDRKNLDQRLEALAASYEQQ